MVLLVKSEGKKKRKAAAEIVSESKAEVIEVEVLTEPKNGPVDISISEPEIEVLPAGVELLPEVTDSLPETGEAEFSRLPKPGRSSELVPYDALSAYLREISQYHPLSRQEEQSLALDYYHNKSVEAAYQLVSSNLALVVKIARDYERAARSLLDLVQEGNIGLMEAVKNFDPFRGVRFPSYAVWWIKAYIIRYVIANWRMVKIGTTQAQRKLFFNLHKEKEKLEREGFYPGPRLLAEKLDVRESDVVEMEQRLSGADMSVDQPVSGDSDTSLLSLLPSDAVSAEEILLKMETRTLLFDGLRDFAATLKAKESLIFERRMLNEEKATLQELATELSISAERVRQIENRLREKLKGFLLERFGSASDVIELGNSGS
jgi:RNA polymerase sigma-32 factor